MCGRFYVPEKDLDDFAGLVDQIEKHLLKKAGEICPGDYAPIITPRPKTDAVLNNPSGEGYAVHAVKWGFPTQKGSPIINARSETVHEKPLFKLPFATKRCLVPTRGFFEWKDAENSRKRIKHYISYMDARLMYLAGLYWFFKDKNGVQVPYFAVLTTQANPELKNIHDRMPVIIDETQSIVWLYENDNPSKLHEMMKPLDTGKLVIRVQD